MILVSVDTKNTFESINYETVHADMYLDNAEYDECLLVANSDQRMEGTFN